MHYRAWAPPTDCSHLLFLPHCYDTKHFVKTMYFITAIKKNSYFWETASCGKIKASILEVIKKRHNTFLDFKRLFRGKGVLRWFKQDLSCFTERQQQQRKMYLRRKHTLKFIFLHCAEQIIQNRNIIGNLNSFTHHPYTADIHDYNS